jgi:hypothetical protein
MFFVQAALTVPTSVDNLQQYSATIGDLSTFIDNAQLDQMGMYDSRYLAPLFAGKDMDLRQDPILVGQFSKRSCRSLRGRLQQIA